MPHRDTDHVLTELEETINQLQTQKQRDNQRRKQASITDHYGGPAERSDPGEFVGSLELVVPHSSSTGGDRPLPRRSDGESAPRFSSALELTTGGSDPDRLQPGTDYKLTVTVRNNGTFSTPTAPLELFAEHYQPTATVDVSDGTLQLDRSSGQHITGFTTLPPGARIFGVGFDRGASTLSSDTIRFVGSWEVNSDRTFDIEGDLSKVSSGDYTLRLYDALGMPPQKKPMDTLVSASEIGDTRLDGYPDHVVDGLTVLTEVDGVFTELPFNDKRPMNLASSLDRATFVTHQEVAHQPRASTQASFTYTTPNSRSGRVLTAFYVRTYARAPEDLPADMSQLDHTQSRFVGRTERNWSR